jgi:hypothetical protein
MANHFRPVFLLFLLPVVVLSTFSCATPGYRAHPDFEQRVNSIKHPALMPLDVKVFESLPGGMVVPRDDWTTIGKENLQNAVLKGFAERNTAVRLLNSEGEMHAELAEIQSLYKVVNKSIRLQFYGRASTANGARNFEYSLGSLTSILNKLDADAIIFACALEKISNHKSMAIVNLALADASGTIIWYSVDGIRDRHGLIDSSGAEELVKKVMMSYPKAGG